MNAKRGSLRQRGTPQKRPRKGTSRRRLPAGGNRLLLRVFGGAMLGGVLFLAGLFFWSLSPGEVQGKPGQFFLFRVESSDKGATVRELDARGALASPILTRLYATWLTPGAHFVPRDHLLSPGISARELVQRLADVGSRPQAEITFPEGWTHVKMGARLEALHICAAESFQKAAFDPALLERLKVPGRSAEGYLFPARYRFALDSEPAHVVTRLVSETKKRVASLKASHPGHPDLARANIDEHGLIVLASIVERETALLTESPRVARVFLNRLLFPEAETRGRLQSDPTAAYGCLVTAELAPSCRDFSGSVTPELLSDPNNPYNTYRHLGLPPGPISNPGEQALRAVLSPAEGNELYFVADGRGKHSFSETFEQHRKAVMRLKESQITQKNH